jgi:hypothetical protein
VIVEQSNQGTAQVQIEMPGVPSLTLLGDRSRGTTRDCHKIQQTYRALRAFGLAIGASLFSQADCVSSTKAVACGREFNLNLYFVCPNRVPTNRETRICLHDHIMPSTFGNA